MSYRCFYGPRGFNLADTQTGNISSVLGIPRRAEKKTTTPLSLAPVSRSLYTQQRGEECLAVNLRMALIGAEINGDMRSHTVSGGERKPTTLGHHEWAD